MYVNTGSVHMLTNFPRMNKSCGRQNNVFTTVITTKNVHHLVEPVTMLPHMGKGKQIK